MQELVGYLQHEGHLQGQEGSGVRQPPNLDQLINLLQRSQVLCCQHACTALILLLLLLIPANAPGT